MLFYAGWTENLYKSNKKSPLLLLQGAENAINILLYSETRKAPSRRGAPPAFFVNGDGGCDAVCIEHLR